MLAKSLGIACPAQCERLLAHAYLIRESRLVSIAYRLGNSQAVELARQLQKLPHHSGRTLAVRTLEEAGWQGPERPDTTGLLRSVKALCSAFPLRNERQ